MIVYYRSNFSSLKEMMKLDAAEYKCPNCNADLKFDPATQKLACEFCGSSFTVEEIKKICAKAENSIPTEAQLENMKDFEDHTNLFHCASCGADIMCDDQQTALFCYYCHNPVILAGKLTGQYKPNKVIGFKLTKEKATEQFKNWIKKRTFVPTEFKSSQQLEKITGLYVPFWVADCDVDAEYCALGKKVRSWTSGGYRYTETNEFRIVRRAEVHTDGIPADGESKIDDALMEAIEPFDYKELKDFSMSYLSGFFADKYDVDKAMVFPRIRVRAQQASKDVVHGSVSGYTTVVPSVENYNIMNTDWQYMMLPVWFMTYKFNDKNYYFAMNGETGKVTGILPLSKKKLFWASCLVGMIGFILGVIGGGIFL